MELNTSRQSRGIVMTPEATASSVDKQQNTPELTRKRKIVQKVGSIALESAAMFAGAAVTYGALRAGSLDSISVGAQGDLGDQLSFSLAAGMPAGRVVHDRARALLRRKK